MKKVADAVGSSSLENLKLKTDDSQCSDDSTQERKIFNEYNFDDAPVNKPTTNGWNIFAIRVFSVWRYLLLGNQWKNYRLRYLIKKGINQNKHYDFVEYEIAYPDKQRFLSKDLFQRKLITGDIVACDCLIYSPSQGSVYYLSLFIVGLCELLA